MKKLALLTLIAVALAVIAGAANAAVVTISTTAPIATPTDESNLVAATGLHKWFNDKEHEAGQTFTPSANLQLKSFTIQLGAKNDNDGADEWVNVRLGTITRPEGVFTFTDIYAEEAHQTQDWAAGDYVTFTLNTPPDVTGGVEYGVILDGQQFGSWSSGGIPYINTTGNTYAGGALIGRGTSNGSNDMVFHADLVDSMQPQPIAPLEESNVPAGNVDLIWTNIDPNNGNPIYIDVLFGTDPCALELVLDGVLDVNTVTVNAPGAGKYYWQVNTDIGETSIIEGPLFVFYVIDSDGDGFPDEYELEHTSSATALNAGDDLDSDGLTNWEEYQLGTNPTIFDTDGDTLGDGEELDGVDLRPATDPLLADTDGDGFDDGVESNTGVYVDAFDVGTDPTNADTDNDGLTDGVETNTGIFVDETDTGTNPFVADSDGDGATDWYEVAASYTNPADAADFPVIPYPLPDFDPCDVTTDFTTKPVKVYILSGQSNMVGFGRIAGSASGTLETIVKRENKFPNLVDDEGNWVAREDVYYRGVISAIGNGPLRPGFGANGNVSGPELGFGQVMGYYHDEPVLLIKSSIGNRSLSWDVASPSTPRFDYEGYTYAGYGDMPNRWLIGEGPSDYVWYCGYEWDRFFLNELDFSPTAASVGLTNAFNVTDVLDNFAAEYPQFAAQGFEIAGYVWWQGNKDMNYGEPLASRYEFNMVNFIKDIRDYYEIRYPSNTNPSTPFVLATYGENGWDMTGSALTVANGQLDAGDPEKHPEFAGNVKTIEARGYWRDSSISPTGAGYHYNGNAETYMLVGDALGRAMIELDAEFSIQAGDSMVTWSGEPVVMNPTIDPNVVVQSLTWSAVSSDPENTTVVFSATDVENPTVTITKNTGDMAVVSVTLTVDDGVNEPVKSSLTIDVYDDGCQAARQDPDVAIDHPADLAGDDCTIGLEDLAVLASYWLNDLALSAPQHKTD